MQYKRELSISISFLPISGKEHRHKFKHLLPVHVGHFRNPQSLRSFLQLFSILSRGTSGPLSRFSLFVKMDVFFQKNVKIIFEFTLNLKKEKKNGSSK